jgi:hypothetical protein
MPKKKVQRNRASFEPTRSSGFPQSLLLTPILNVVLKAEARDEMRIPPFGWEGSVRDFSRNAAQDITRRADGYRQPRCQP